MIMVLEIVLGMGYSWIRRTLRISSNNFKLFKKLIFRAANLEFSIKLFKSQGRTEVTTVVNFFVGFFKLITKNLSNFFKKVTQIPYSPTGNAILSFFEKSTLPPSFFFLCNFICLCFWFISKNSDYPIHSGVLKTTPRYTSSPFFLPIIRNLILLVRKCD